MFETTNFKKGYDFWQDAQNKKGNEKTQDYNSALKFFRAEIKLNSFKEESCLFLGRTHLALNQLADAFRCFEYFHKFRASANSSNLYYLLASFYEAVIKYIKYEGDKDIFCKMIVKFRSIISTQANFILITEDENAILQSCFNKRNDFLRSSAFERLSEESKNPTYLDFFRSIFDYIEKKTGEFLFSYEKLWVEINLFLGSIYWCQGDCDVRDENFKKAQANFVKARREFSLLSGTCKIKNFYIAKTYLKEAEAYEGNKLAIFKCYKEAIKKFRVFITWHEKTDFSKASTHDLYQYYGLPRKLIKEMRGKLLGSNLKKKLTAFGDKNYNESKASYKELLLRVGWYDELFTYFGLTKSCGSKEKVIETFLKIYSDCRPIPIINWCGVITVLLNTHSLAPDFKQVLLKIRGLLYKFPQQTTALYFSNMNREKVARKILYYSLWWYSFSSAANNTSFSS